MIYNESHIEGMYNGKIAKKNVSKLGGLVKNINGKIIRRYQQTSGLIKKNNNGKVSPCVAQDLDYGQRTGLGWWASVGKSITAPLVNQNSGSNLHHKHA